MKLPLHVSMIMDGNGRWAKEKGKERLFGHAEGIESVRACTEYAVERGIKYLSLFAFSTENWNRPVEEVEGLMRMMIKAISNETPTFVKNGIRFRVIGDFSGLSQELQQEIEDCQKLTEKFNNLTLIVFLSYSGKWDILQAARKAAQTGESNISEKEFESYLSTAGIPDPDLIIRTSGEQRISNYMLWQAAYSELYFTKTLWPDFRKNEFRLALEEYASRSRRFGKI
ncbi:MAG: polyprenyl diphosphate synthase [Bacteroidales bacterium]|nr:polyprenyl diphosphate synthase [Bacteroidales bacterium]